jgi:uncharacterized protein
MGFDQYHEPPDELPAATRTFARLCASLTEEAEAIGWYEQRLAIENDPQAVAIMRDAQGEEFKHFSMDLEFLLRRTPHWREIARGVLFQPGDIVEHGEEAEAEVNEEGASEADEDPAGSLEIGSLKGAVDEPSASLARARQRLGLGAARRRGPEQAHCRARRTEGGRLRRPERLGALGHEPRTGQEGQSRSGRGRDGPATGGLAARRAAGGLRDRALRAPRLRPRPSGRRSRRARRGSAQDRGRREHRRLQRLEGRRHHRHREGVSAQGTEARCRSGVVSPARRGRSSSCSRPGSADRTRSPWAGSSTRAWSRRPSTAATRSSTTCARSWTVRSSGRRAWRGRGRQRTGRRLPLRVGSGLRSTSTTTTRTGRIARSG